MLLFEATLGLLKALGARPRDRPGLFGAPLVKAALGLAQPPPPALRGRQLGGRQLISASLAKPLILLGIDRVGLLENLAVTDPDSRNVKTPRGYMQGYNAQAATNEHQIVIAAEVTVDSPDFGHIYASG